MLARWIRICWVFGSQPSISNLGSQKTQKNIEKAHHPDFFRVFLLSSSQVSLRFSQFQAAPWHPVTSRDIPWPPTNPSGISLEKMSPGRLDSQPKWPDSWSRPRRSPPHDLNEWQIPTHQVLDFTPKKENPLLNKPRPSQAYVTSGTSGTPLK